MAPTKEEIMMEYKIYQGHEIGQIKEELSALRIEVFSEYPYLYSGDQATEEQYVGDYATNSTAYVAIAFDQGEAVGAITALALSEAYEGWLTPFKEQGYKIEEFCYFGEIVLRKSHRSGGIGRILWQMAEEYAAQLGKPKITLCTVDRAENHPLRASDYLPISLLLEKRNYHKVDSLKCRESWQRIDLGGAMTENELTFWVKSL